MEVEIEMHIVHPEWPREVARYAEHPLTQSRSQVEPRLDDSHDVVVGERTLGPGVQHGHAGDVHVHGRALQVEEARVQAGQTFGCHGVPSLPLPVCGHPVHTRC